MRAFVDVDDLWSEDQIERYLLPIKEHVPDFGITCYSIPNKLGPVHDLKQRYPWIVFAQHGWEHVPFECRTWTEEQALHALGRGAEMGYAPIFKPPNWTFDIEVVRACDFLGVTLHHHLRNADFPFPPGLLRYPGGPPKDHVNLHSHIAPNPVTDDILTSPDFRISNLQKVTEFLTIDQVSVGGWENDD